MKKYSLTSSVFIGQVLIGYRNARMIFFDAENVELSEIQYDYFIENILLAEADIHSLVQKSKTLSIKEIPADLTFENFWNTYNYRVGNMSRAKKLWAALTEADKIKVFESLPKYESYLRNKNIEKLYPETFLSQRRFENQF